MNTEDIVQENKIAILNDAFRQQKVGYLFTRGIIALDMTLEILKLVQDYSNFNENNDPYGEHDFGSFEFMDNKMFWKIDYYDQASQKWHDPLDPGCERVLTVLLAGEY
ncbi:hypothetical protein CVV43_04105 [Candidatus Saccharibacteria bacterium HGW-Saccharibacteria-1]|jgi:hypothetical protein|nr:MAG: hypothetical protein CVV43_04105 [Candidatus Saccharibacteria bacterium HGW-Saccharibacteria-1]